MILIVFDTDKPIKISSFEIQFEPDELKEFSDGLYDLKNNPRYEYDISDGYSKDDLTRIENTLYLHYLNKINYKNLKNPKLKSIIKKNEID